MPKLIPTVRKTLSGLAGALDVFGRKSSPVRSGRPARSSFPPATVLFFLLSANAAEKLTPIGEVLRDQDANYVPDRLGETFTVSGVLISSPVNLREFGPDATEHATLVNLQDGTGGIALFTRNTALLASGFKGGDAVQARGKLSQHDGVEELLLTEIRRLGAGAMPQPHDVLTADVRSERYSGQLVRVVGELVVPSDLLDTRRGLALRDRSGEIPVMVADGFFSDPRFASRLMQGGKVEIVGIASQYCKDPPFNSGYRLLPRDPGDFAFHPLPPYKVIAITLALAVLSFASVYLWLRRRRVEERARELTLLTDNLTRSEEALRQSEERFRKVFEEGPIGIVLGSPDFRILKANRALCQMLGYTEGELTGLRFADITHPEDAERTLQLGRELFGGKIPSYQLDQRYVTKCQRIIWANVTATLIRGHDGQPLYAIGIIEDISKRKEAEQVLEQNEKRFRALIEKSSDCISLVSH